MQGNVRLARDDIADINTLGLEDNCRLVRIAQKLHIEPVEPDAAWPGSTEATAAELGGKPSRLFNNTFHSLSM